MTTLAISPWELGASLYMPASQRDLLAIANGEKGPKLRSMIFCTEDAVSNTDLAQSIQHLGLCLQGFRSKGAYRFIRARNPDVLSRLLDLPNIDVVDGFVLPKFNLQVFNAYCDQLQGTPFKIMPTLETKEVFDYQAMLELRQAMLQAHIIDKIVLLRIGGNDLMSLLGMKRPRRFTLYDTPLGLVIKQLVTWFKPYSFNLSAPVFDYLGDPLTLQREIELDLAHGLVGKTAIHPNQVALIEQAYQVDYDDYDMALKITDPDALAVFKLHNTMCEVATHTRWALDILERHQYYGCQYPFPANDCIEVPCL